MKRLLFLVFIGTSLLASSQNYKLFNAGSKKVFTTFPDAGPTYSLAFDSVISIGADSVYFTYFLKGDALIYTDTCGIEPYLVDSCLPNNKPIWTGHQIEGRNDRQYRFFNKEGDTLAFDFRTDTGDSLLFYTDETQSFFIDYELTDTLSILGIVDSVRIFRILHQDLEGNAINSLLNNQQIVIAKSFGLFRFFHVYDFPSSLLPLVLVGNNVPDAGLVKLTNEMIFDHQPGDVIQYSDYYLYSYLTYHRYIKHTFLERSITPTHLYYTVAREIFYRDSLTVEYDTITLGYIRTGIVAETPYDGYQNLINYSVYSDRTLYPGNYLGYNTWLYNDEPSDYFNYFCTYDNCWQLNTNPPERRKIMHGIGLGLLKDEHSLPISFQDDRSLRVIYFTKNGIEYGDDVVLGIDQNPLSENSISVFPNPAGDKLFIKSASVIDGTIRIFNLNGQIILETWSEKSLTEISTEHLRPGVYLIKVIGSRGVTVKKFIRK
jgi:hypothetical protein